MDVLEGGHRVPAIAWWPGKIPALSVTNQTAMTMDLLPTFLDVLNVPLPANEGKNKLDGVSLLPLLLKETPLTPRTLYWRIRDLKAVRQGYWKLVSGNNSVALYNLANDIGEAKDVAKEYPDIVRALESKLAIWEKDVDK